MNAAKERLTDTHCHLMLPAFDKDREEVIARACTVGVARILVPGVDLETSRQAVELAQNNAHIFAAVGIHPHNARTWNSRIKAEIGQLARSPGVVAIGEIGLDFYRNLSTPEEQKLAFRAQLTLAAEMELPVVIHNRQAIDDVLEDLLPWSQDVPPNIRNRAGVLHAFSAEDQAARLAIEAGFYLGVAGPLTYRNAQRQREIVSQMPITRQLLETDSPYLTPHPFRSKRNEPAHVKLVAERFADVMGISVRQAVDATWQNASDLFDWNHGNHDRHLL